MLLFMICSVFWQMLGALSQLEVSSDIWEQVLHQGLEILPELVDEPLAAVMSFVFKAAAESQQLPQAVCTLIALFFSTHSVHF